MGHLIKMRLYRIQSCSISTGKYSTFVASKCKHSMQPNEHSAHVAPLGYTTTKIFIVISSGGATKYDILSMINPLIPRNATWLYMKLTVTIARHTALLVCKTPLVRRILVFLMLDVFFVVDVPDGGVEFV